MTPTEFKDFSQAPKHTLLDRHLHVLRRIYRCTAQQPQCYRRYLNPFGNPRACSSASVASLHRERCFLNAQHITIDMALVNMQMRYEFTYEGPQLDCQKYLRWREQKHRVRGRRKLTMHQCCQMLPLCLSVRWLQRVSTAIGKRYSTPRSKI